MHTESSRNPEILGVHQNVSKSKFYQPSISYAGFVNLFNCRDKQVHAHKLRIMGPAFSETALKNMEDLILKHIDEFFEYGSNRHQYKDSDQCWTTDLGKWGNYLTFDVMGDVVFGKDYGMVRGAENRNLPSIIDAAAHWQLLVGDVSCSQKCMEV